VSSVNTAPDLRIIEFGLRSRCCRVSFRGSC